MIPLSWFKKKISLLLLILSIFGASPISLADPTDNSTQLQQQVRQLQSDSNNATITNPLPLPSLSNPQNTPMQSTNNSTLSPTLLQNNVASAPEALAATPSPLPNSSLNADAFSSTTTNLLPMSADQIEHLRKLFDDNQSAASVSPGTPPRPMVTTQYVSLAPGVTPTVIRLAQGYVSTLAFIDATGAPWPIDSFDIGNPQAFHVQWDKKSNLMMIQAMNLYSNTNLAVQLAGSSTAIMLTLVSGQKAVDYRSDLRIQGRGPNAQALLGRSLPESENPILLNILDGVAPTGSQVLSVSGGDAQAWLVDGSIFLRTRLTLLSPAWIATLSSPEGTKVYQLPKTPLLLVSENGQTLQLKIEGF